MNLLKNITILDISRLLPGGFASLLLREMGARVIKIEQPDVGDYYRAATADGLGLLPAHMRMIHAQKECLGLDLKQEEGQKIFFKLLKQADVVIESFRPGVLKKLKLDLTQLKKINPRIILCSITGFGQKTPQSSLAGHDLNFLGLSGILRQLRDETGKYILPDIQITDLAAGQEAAMKICAALATPKKQRKALHIDISMIEAGQSLVRFCDFSSKAPHLVTGASPRYGVYQTKDGQITVGALEQKFWKSLCALVNHPEWEGAGMGHDLQEDRRIQQELSAILQSQPSAYWIQHGQAADLCLFAVEEDPDMRHYTKPVPRLGQHSTKILRQIGLSTTAIQSLKKQKVIA